MLSIMTAIIGFLSIEINGLFYVWIVLGSVTAVVSYFWDLIVEFDLLRKDSKISIYNILIDRVS